MVNITYNGCELLLTSLTSSTLTCHPCLAGAIVWYDTAFNPPKKIVYSPGDIAWVLASTALVWIMVPGVGFFYSGLARRKSALSLIWLSLMSVAVVSFQVTFSHCKSANG